MKRPDRQKRNLVAKLERKLTRTNGKAGAKAKRWKRSIDGVKNTPKVVEEAAES
jgi:hypothetical protein